jgi:phosphomevalonate kinase
LIVRAPGKIVLWGEYAVLTGAPAAVMAVDRWARVELQPTKANWRFGSRGFLSPALHKSTAEYCAAPTVRLAETILQHWGYTEFPEPFQLNSDSRAFHHANGTKLGLGSSAAICCATYIALAKLLNKSTSVTEVMQIHHAFQGGKGSGLDVAASWHGGVIRFSKTGTTAWSWPEHWHWQALWTGQAASTPSSLGSFSTWQETHDTKPLVDLTQTCEELFRNPSLALLQHYADQLAMFDKAAQLNIFTPAHTHLATIAHDHGLIYKPCGAGGGDIGLACGEDPDALKAFASRAADNQFVPLNLEIAGHGVTVG